jgi:hypothetical protein
VVAAALAAEKLRSTLRHGAESKGVSIDLPFVREKFGRKEKIPARREVEDSLTEARRHGDQKKTDGTPAEERRRETATEAETVVSGNGPLSRPPLLHRETRRREELGLRELRASVRGPGHTPP